MLKKIFNLLKDSASDKVNSPILRTFFSFWLVVNWKIPLILIFSDANIEEKIKKIDEIHNLIDGFAYPFIFALVFVWSYPFLKGLALRFEFWAEHSLIISKNLSKVETLYSEVELDRIKKEIENTETQELLESRFNRLNKESAVYKRTSIIVTILIIILIITNVALKIFNA